MSERLARAVVAADALYCLGLGSMLVTQRRSLSQLTAYPPDVLAATGAGTMLLGVGLGGLSRADNWSAVTRTVGIANAAAVTVLGWFGNNRGGQARQFLAGLALQIGAFAVLQLLFGRRR